MGQADDNDDFEGSLRHFDVELFIVHPNLSPEEITTTLGLEPSHVHAVGKPRKTPKGTSLPGTYSDTRWRFTARYEVRDQWFATRLKELVDRLMPHKEFLRRVRSTGGTAAVGIQFLGVGYFGDKISRAVLSKLVELDLDFGIESFDVPQNLVD